MKETMGLWLRSVWNQIPGLENYMMNLILVSAVSAVLILLLAALRPMFKERYTIGLKQFLWMILAIRLIVPFSYGETIFSVQSMEYDTGAKVYISKKITDEEKKKPESVYMTLPEGVDRESAIYSMAAPFLAAEENAVSYSDKVVAVQEGNYTSAPVPVDEKNWKEKVQYYLIQAICVMNSHIEVIVTVYLAGVVLFLLYHGMAMLYFRNKRKKVRVKVNHAGYFAIMLETAKRIGVKRIPQLYQIDGLASPMATGFFRFSIYIPAEDYTEKEFRALITHELTHIYHQDLRIKMLYLLANALHWFNPAVYVMLREAARDMELYCDKSIVKMLQWEERQEYNELLLRILRSHGTKDRQEYMTTCFKGGVKEMKERFLLNLDMRKKREGILPILLAGGLIALSAGLFSMEVTAKSHADEEEFWADWMYQESSEKLSLEEITSSGTHFSENYEYEDESMLQDGILLQFRMGDAACEEVCIEKDGDNYLIPNRYHDGTGLVFVEKTAVAPEREEWEEVPRIQIFCNETAIKAYDVEVCPWQEGDAPKLEYEPEFFAGQCGKGEENPVFEVRSWREYTGEIRIFFPAGQMPDVVDISDIVLNEDGSVRYEGKDAEVIYRVNGMDKDMDMISAPLAQHYSITTYENPYNRELLSQPFYRGYKVRCYWGGKSKLQSCVYYFVLRTRTTVYDEEPADAFFATE